MSLPLEDKDCLTVELANGDQVTYEVVCIAEDDNNKQVAICYCSSIDDFMATDLQGIRIDSATEQSVVDAFLHYIDNQD